LLYFYFSFSYPFPRTIGIDRKLINCFKVGRNSRKLTSTRHTTISKPQTYTFISTFLRPIISAKYFVPRLQGKCGGKTFLSAEFWLKCKAFALPYTGVVLLHIEDVRSGKNNAVIARKNRSKLKNEVQNGQDGNNPHRRLNVSYLSGDYLDERISDESES